jgi:hypothetical protein
MKKHETTSNSEINFLRKLYNKFIKVKWHLIITRLMLVEQLFIQDI